MRKVLVAFALCLFASASFAASVCDKQTTKAQTEDCYKQSIAEKKEALEEFHDDAMESSNIPPAVKAQLDKDYRSFMKNIYFTCPDLACVDLAMMEQIKDMFKEIRPYTIPK